MNNWTLSYGAGANPTGWFTIATGTTNVTGSTLGNWATGSIVNGSYTIRLQVWDKAGNLTTTTVSTVMVDNFSVSQNVLQFNPASATTTYTSTVPFTLNENLYIKNLSGQTVRTLFNGQRTAATYNDVWNGKNDQNVFVPDGPYFYIAVVTAGSSNMTWDLSNVFPYVNEYNITFTVPAFDCFNNQPATLTYNLTFPMIVTVGWYIGILVIRPGPANPVITARSRVSIRSRLPHRDMGWNRRQWCSSHGYTTPQVTADRRIFPANAVVLYGLKPVITNFGVNPVVFGPKFGTQAVTFNMTTYLNASVTVTLRFTEHSVQFDHPYSYNQ